MDIKKAVLSDENSETTKKKTLKSEFVILN